MKHVNSLNDWLLGKFRANLQRMDRANSLDLILDDLESLAAPAARVLTRPNVGAVAWEVRTLRGCAHAEWRSAPGAESAA